MIKKKILIWDDIQKQLNSLERLVLKSMEENEWDFDISTSSKSFDEEFLPFLKSNYRSFDLLIMDAYEETNPNEKSFVIEEALSTLSVLPSMKLKVIAVSMNQSILSDDNSFRKLGNDYSFCIPVLKLDFKEKTSEKSCEKLLAKVFNLEITKSGLTRDISTQIEPDIFLNHQIGILGGYHTLKQMIYEGKQHNTFLALDNSYKIEGLSQGLSGAIVIKIQFTNLKGSTSYRFVKISSNYDKLYGEYMKSINEYIEYFPQEYAIPYINAPIKFANYYFLEAKLFENSTSLRKFIQDNSDSDIILVLLKEIMTECFAEVYSKSCEQLKEDKTTCILKIFKSNRLAFLKTAIKELDCLVGDQIEIVNKLSNIINNYTFESDFYTSDSPHYKIVHNDLHGNNILINKINQGAPIKKNIKIIDPANIDVNHWSRDICMLIVDIFAFGIDADKAEFFGITRIDDWKKMGELIIQNSAIDNGGNNKGVVDAINWLSNVDILKSIFPFKEFTIWEFQLSLCVEFLRISYKQDQLPPGKRAACLLIGVEAYRVALESFKKFKEEYEKNN